MSLFQLVVLWLVVTWMIVIVVVVFGFVSYECLFFNLMLNMVYLTIMVWIEVEGYVFEEVEL